MKICSRQGITENELCLIDGPRDLFAISSKTIADSLDLPFVPPSNLLLQLTKGECIFSQDRQRLFRIPASDGRKVLTFNVATEKEEVFCEIESFGPFGHKLCLNEAGTLFVAIIGGPLEVFNESGEPLASDEATYFALPKDGRPFWEFGVATVCANNDLIAVGHWKSDVVDLFKINGEFLARIGSSQASSESEMDEVNNAKFINGNLFIMKTFTLDIVNLSTRMTRTIPLSCLELEELRALALSWHGIDRQGRIWVYSEFGYTALCED